MLLFKKIRVQFPTNKKPLIVLKITDSIVTRIYMANDKRKEEKCLMVKIMFFFY